MRHIYLILVVVSNEALLFCCYVGSVHISIQESSVTTQEPWCPMFFARRCGIEICITEEVDNCYMGTHDSNDPSVSRPSELRADGINMWGF